MSQTLEHLFLKIRLTQERTSTPTTTLSLLLSVRRLITDLGAAVAFKLSGYGRWRAIHSCRDLADCFPGLAMLGNGATLFQRKLSIVLSHRNTLYKKCCLKTRARENFIYYNRLTDEPGGRASYELEFPVGGLAFVVGNLIEQGEETENPTIISFGAEGYKWSRNQLYLSHNTIVNDKLEGGVFILARPGSAYVKALNNILVGKGDLDLKTRADIGQNWRLDRSEFVLPEGFDFRLKPNSQAAGAADEPGEARGVSLRPTQEYSYRVGTELLLPASSFSPGAFQNRTRKNDPALP